ncbi:IscS subfamily cysteine desulfurase [Xenorhabdus budapestensis]|uniref:IscS subfamily cysteine desulfurase n=1 Tax=Xenorhabdus budapestensis TaxID=290110 RepID=A0A2D0J3E5_XENBU|nr:IscS subfamily cysteine desulfurase [Xenorhabdus budapestensis]PHM28731.1 NifS protein [Xenorhabdus budapestensis]QTL38273.1 IscS subfamily cysteine desulfurase [Xenorhabdus budapestensis]
MIYLDYASSAPVSHQALDTFQKLSQCCYGNASSLHDAGEQASVVLSYCRRQLARFLGGDPSGVYFTSCGTEANLLGIQSLARALPSGKRHIVTTKMEHPSVHYAMQALEEAGFIVTVLTPDTRGIVTEAILAQALRPDTGLISIQHANSETGIVQPIAQLAQLTKGQNILFHTDAVQTFGKIPVLQDELGVDAISISSHKVYAPKGAGAVYIRPGIPWRPLYPTVTHENGFRPGTVNVPLIGAFITACEETMERREQDEQWCRMLRNRLIRGLRENTLPVSYFSDREHELLPGIFGCFYSGVEGQYAMLSCNRRGVCIATGSACTAGQQAPSGALTALGLSNRDALQFIRISFGRYTSEEDIDVLLQALVALRHEIQQEPVFGR